MADLAVAIPSYRRPELIKTKTLEVLRRAGVDPMSITVWVADAAEHQVYAEAFDAEDCWLDPVNVSIGAPGLCDCRNMYFERYPEGTWLVQMDDDVDDVRCRYNAKEHGPVDDLVAWWREMFATADSLALRLWGVYPVLNPMFMKPGMTTDLRLCPGPMFGTIVRLEDADTTHVHVPGAGEKEDFERTMRYYLADGGVLRANDVACKTKFYRPDGGIHAAGRTMATERAAVDYLLATFPELVAERPPRKSGFPEVRLKDRRPQGAPT